MKLIISKIFNVISFFALKTYAQREKHVLSLNSDRMVRIYVADHQFRMTITTSTQLLFLLRPPPPLTKFPD